MLRRLFRPSPLSVERLEDRRLPSAANLWQPVPLVQPTPAPAVLQTSHQSGNGARADSPSSGATDTTVPAADNNASGAQPAAASPGTSGGTEANNQANAAPTPPAAADQTASAGTPPGSAGTADSAPAADSGGTPADNSTGADNTTPPTDGGGTTSDSSGDTTAGGDVQVIPFQDDGTNGDDGSTAGDDGGSSAVDDGSAAPPPTLVSAPVEASGAELHKGIHANFDLDLDPAVAVAGVDVLASQEEKLADPLKTSLAAADPLAPPGKDGHYADLSAGRQPDNGPEASGPAGADQAQELPAGPAGVESAPTVVLQTADQRCGTGEQDSSDGVNLRDVAPQTADRPALLAAVDLSALEQEVQQLLHQLDTAGDQVARSPVLLGLCAWGAAAAAAGVALEVGRRQLKQAPSDVLWATGDGSDASPWFAGLAPNPLPEEE